MTDQERKALAALTFNWAEAPDDVWRPSPFHVESLHRQTGQILLTGLAEAAASRDVSPIGVVVEGQRGSGKTHLLGWLRERTREQGGYFFLVSLLDARSFWASVMVSVLDSLAREEDDGEGGRRSQLQVFLDRLAALVGVPRMVRRAVVGTSRLARMPLDTFVDAFRRFDRTLGRDTQDTLRALVLLASDDLAAQDIGDAFLSSTPEEDQGERARWGIRRSEKSQQEIVMDLSRLLALTGPSVIAVDQIDMLIAQSSLSMDGDSADHRDLLLVEQIAGGLMALREATRRTLTVVSCLPPTWVLIETHATATVQDRFRKTAHLKTIPDAETGHALIAKRFGAQFGEIGFTPPYPTWPIRPSAFDDARDYTPRQLLIKINDHVQSCLRDGEIRELEHLAASAPVENPVAPGEPLLSAVPPESSGQDLSALDARFARLRETADVAAALDAATEDAVMPALLSAGLTAWIAGQGEAGQAFSQDPPPSSKPPLHARLRRSLDVTTEDEAHWCFRAVATGNANAALSRVRHASVAAGLDAAIPKRRLFLLRNTGWSKGPRTREIVTAFEEAGGRVLQVDPEDLRILAALRDLIAGNPPGLHGWLATRRPADEVKLFGEALGDAWTVPAGPAGPTAPGPRATAPAAGGTGLGNAGDGGGGTAPAADEATGPRGDRAPYVTLGRAITGDAPVEADLEALRKHTAVFAGSGSGKTVLIRRLVEECALQGVSSIVLDPNNDLARLGDPWPEAPPSWGVGDAARAREYLDTTDVVVWTPGRGSGRPLSFQPLPDFRSVLDDPDEFTEAVEVAVASIAPRARLTGSTEKAHRGQAVLREALRYYGQHGANDLRGLIATLAELPDGVSALSKAGRIAADLAETLTAAMVIDPMFGGKGTPVDPGILLTPPEGKRARVSVVNLSGLQSDEQRQSFVNRLQMALFAWIKRNPAGDRPLGGLFVMDEAQTFAPSGALTACTQSTLALASQARKYGLGLVFATQAPKGLHNRIPGNAATQFFGLLNSYVQIETAKEMARSRGGHVTDVARLRSGQFYVATEGSAFVKAQVPMCLSHHPRDPLTVEEVVRRAGGSARR
ncbi:ATP-binding protein [Planomonospora venezuelensis]|uniref:AAA+ ATPase domain-containing protein n=1 Tax=Planomonospora venezuelensis TaxID=1999 RepID=A0A841D663_PLAVE|nr:ATP-binding protein [Planomonospora venezuelensis]MBB5963635.1 hypothetical protein [Planomonospora venezuelensis]GIN01423.1 ATPase [Planomonospora venezuelensis]